MSKPSPAGQAPRTDLGTVLLHWLAVLAIGVLLATGLAIAADAPDRAWLQALRIVLPGGDVWLVHVLAGGALVVVAAAYAVYLRSAHLTGRMRLDRARLHALRRRGRARRSALNVMLHWLLLGLVATQVATGVLLYLGHGGSVASVHYRGALLIVVVAGVHVLAHYAMGRGAELLRILRPGPLVATGAPPSLADLIRERLEREEKARARPPSEPSLNTHPLAVAGLAALTAAGLVASLDRVDRDTLVVRAIARAEAPRLDGDLAEPVWRRAPAVGIETNQGVNFGGTGASKVVVRAVHDGTWAFIALTWEDPTRSLKHLPLVKRSDGWHLLHSRYDIEDENDYYEDKLAVMLAERPTMPAAGSIHLGARPLAGKPAASSGRGLHYTADGSIVDVWHWKATRGGLLGWMDDNYFGAPAEPSAAESEGKSRYKAGYATDPGAAFYANNFKQEPPGGYRGPLIPKRLPLNLAATTAAMATRELDPDHGVPAGARWWMTTEESVAWSEALDQAIPAGTVIPGVLIDGRYSGDRADIRCAAQWAAGRWTLEIARRLDTGSPYDVAIRSGVFLWVAAFDHSQTRHTRHMRPIRIEVE